MKDLLLRFPRDSFVYLNLGTSKSSLNLQYQNKEVVLRDIDNALLSSLDVDYKQEVTIPIILEGKCMKIGQSSIDLEYLLEPGSILTLIKKGGIDVYHNDIKIGEITDDVNLFKGKISSYKALVCEQDCIKVIRYAELHTHSEHSFKDGMIRCKDIADKCEYACALTDHGNMYGTLEFYRAMKAKGKHPIIGCEVYLERIHHQSHNEFQEKSDIDYKRSYYKGDHLILLAKSDIGKINLNKIVSYSNERYHNNPHVTYSLLRKYKQDLIATTACISGTLARAIKNNDNELIDDYLSEMISIFGKDDFYIEIQRHGFAEEEMIMQEILKIARKWDLKIIATNDAHYLNKEDARDHEIWLCQKYKQTMNDENHHRFSGSGYYVHDSEEMYELFSDIPEALDNTLEIAEKCHVNMDVSGKYYLPEYQVKSEYVKETDTATQVGYFIDICKKGYDYRFAGTSYYDNKEYRDRMKFEVDTIISMGYPSYFSIVQDMIKWAEDDDVFCHWQDYFPGDMVARFKELNLPKDIQYALQSFKNEITAEDMRKAAHDYGDDDFKRFVTAITKDYSIYVGKGRGSAAGSLVSYCLGITKINPLKYDLLFERFLNPDRISMPDIDIDFPDIYRENVIEYLRAKYGVDRVCRIVTFGTAAARGAIRLVCRVYKADDDQKDKTVRTSLANKICKTLPENPNIKLKKALEQSSEFKNLYEADGLVRYIVDTAMRLEGLILNESQHACGIIITKGLVTEYMPKVLIEDKDLKVKQWTTQYQAAECESLGCLKIDLLGLRTLSVIDNTCKNINYRLSQKDYMQSYASTAIERYVYKDFDKAKKEIKDILSTISDDMTVIQLIQNLRKEDIRDILSVMYIHSYLTQPDLCYKSTELLRLIKLDNKAVDYSFIPNNDLSVFRFFKTGMVDGVFQIESPYMKSLIQDLLKDLGKNPDLDGNKCFSRLIDANALGRPGPMAEIPHYVDNMLHPENIHYETEVMRKHLDSTNGIMIYQEQMMRLTRILAGFHPGDADTVRKACSKKKKELLDEYGEYFVHGCKDKDIPGCIKMGLKEEVAKAIWEKFKTFGSYGFNKSHSVSYSELTVNTGWLDYYFATEYMTATLNSVIDSANRIKGYISVCNARNIQILPPNINKSELHFQCDGMNIRFGLKGLKNLGLASKSIIEERVKNGPFTDIQSLVYRLSLKGSFNKNIYETLVYSSALDDLPGTRQDKLDAMEYVLNYASGVKEIYGGRQKNIFDITGEAPHPYSAFKMDISDVEMNKQFKLAKEYEFAGFYVTEHPLDEFKNYLKDKNVTPISFLLDEDDEINDEVQYNFTESELDNLTFAEEYIKKDFNFKDVTIAGVLKNIKTKHSGKDNKSFAVFDIEDQTGMIHAVVFNKEYIALSSKLLEGTVMLFRGAVNTDDFGTQIVIKSAIELLNDEDEIPLKEIIITSSHDTAKAREQYVRVKDMTKDSPGKTDIIFVKPGTGRYHMGTLNVTWDLLDELDIIFGEQNLIKKYNS